jgi:hypothetical protein
MRPWLERALPEDRYIDRISVTPDSPQEDEIPLASQQLLSYYHAIYFPRRFDELLRRGLFFEGAKPVETRRWARELRAFYEKLDLQATAPILLVKNPVYTARIDTLLSHWPEARFIHIRRNPFHVFVSTLHFYRRLLPELALQPYDHVELENLVAKTYLDMMARYDRARADLPEGQLAEIAYEDLETAPLAVLEQVHEQLDLEDWEDTRDRVEAYLERIAGYRKNELPVSAAQVERVERDWGPYVRRWGYRAPDVSPSAPRPGGSATTARAP